MPLLQPGCWLVMTNAEHFYLVWFGQVIGLPGIILIAIGALYSGAVYQASAPLELRAALVGCCWLLLVVVVFGAGGGGGCDAAAAAPAAPPPPPPCPPPLRPTRSASASRTPTPATTRRRAGTRGRAPASRWGSARQLPASESVARPHGLSRRARRAQRAKPARGGRRCTSPSSSCCRRSP